MSIIKSPLSPSTDPDDFAKSALNQSYQNCLAFPWINEKIQQKKLNIHRWFFDIKLGQIFTYAGPEQKYQPLEEVYL